MDDFSKLSNEELLVFYRDVVAIAGEFRANQHMKYPDEAQKTMYRELLSRLGDTRPGNMELLQEYTEQLEAAYFHLENHYVCQANPAANRGSYLGMNIGIHCAKYIAVGALEDELRDRLGESDE